MACARRSLASKFTNLSHRFRPSFAHAVTHDDREGGGDLDRRCTPPPLPSLPRSGSILNLGHPLRCGRTLGVLFPMGLDPFSRHFSSTPSRGANGGKNDVEFVENLAESLSDTAIEFPADAAAIPAAIPAATSTFFSSEVSLAAADSFPPVAALQYLIDGVHSFTALNWWACIALTTVLIRGATIPLLLNQMRATAKLNLMKPELEELKEQMQNNVDPESMQEGKRRMEALFKKHGVTPFTPLKGIFIQGPIFISFFLAISNMVEKVPSFKGGGAFWFTDLTACDPTYAMPVLTAVTFLATVECNMQDGVEGNSMAKTMKNFSRGLAVMTVPFTANFPMAIFCYWVTSNLVSLVYGFVVRQPPVRKFLNLPDIVPHPASNPATMPSFPFFGVPTKAVESVASPLAAKVVEQVKPAVQRVSSSAVISQRIRNLEKTVKARSKKKKR